MRRSGGLVVGKVLWSSNRGLEARRHPQALAALKRFAMLGWTPEAAVPTHPCSLVIMARETRILFSL